MSTILFSSIPLMNKLMLIAEEEAKKGGHVIKNFERRRGKNDDIIYVAFCIICDADVHLICTAQKYNRTGTVYTQRCKPG